MSEVNHPIYRWDTCEHCEGAGTLENNIDMCPHCEGQGFFEVNKFREATDKFKASLWDLINGNKLAFIIAFVCYVAFVLTLHYSGVIP